MKLNQKEGMGAFVQLALFAAQKGKMDQSLKLLNVIGKHSLLHQSYTLEEIEKHMVCIKKPRSHPYSK